jgi:hypothetical protein
VLFEPRSRPLDEVLRRIVKVRDDARLEQRVTLSRAHLFELRSSHDISGHVESLHPARTTLPRSWFAGALDRQLEIAASEYRALHWGRTRTRTLRCAARYGVRAMFGALGLKG